MRTNRMSVFQKRAKRRIIALAIGSAAIASWGAVSLFAGDEKLVSTPVAEMSKVPAVRSVGIRLVNANGGKSNASGRTDAPMPAPIVSPMASLPSLPLPSTSAPVLSGDVPLSLPPTLPPSLPPTLPPSLPPSLPARNLPVANGLPLDNSPAPQLGIVDSGLSVAPPSSPAASGMNLGINEAADLTAPPRMPEAAPKSTSGKVIVKLSADTPLSKPVPPSATDVDSVGFRVLPQPSVVPPAKLPALVFNAPAVTAAAPAVEVVTEPEPIRVSIGGAVPERRSSAIATNRVPELVRSKPTQISHTVMLAHSTEIDLEVPNSEGSPSEPVMEDTSLPSRPAIGTVPAVVAAELSDSSSSSSQAPSVKQIASHVGFVSLAPPAATEMDSKRNSPKDIAGADSQSNRPSFDRRWANSSPIATIELESQSATALDLPGSIKSVSIQDEDICRVLHNGKTISFVGDKTGTTLIQIWTGETKDTPQLVRVNVSQPWQKPSSTQGDIREVKQAIASAFPRASVNIVTADDGTIEVRGTTESEESAVRILEIVRKLCLVPVKDKVTVSR
jgi:hypothetical protein